MDKKLFKTVDLADNLHNLKIDVFDGSRKVAGDRWMVNLTLRMEVPVDKKILKEDSQIIEKIEDIKQALGEKVVFEKKMERFFVADGDKNDVFYSLYESFSNNLLSYLSHPEFPKRLILKKYGEFLAKKNLKSNDSL